MSSALVTVMPTTLKLGKIPEEVRICDDRIREKIAHLLEEAAKIIEIKDDVTNNLAALVRRELREIWKSIEGSRKEILKPIDKNRSGVQKFAKGFQDPINTTINDLEKKQNAYAYEVQRKIDEQRRKAEEEEARRAEEAEAAKAAGEPVAEVEPTVSMERGVAKTDFSSTRWTTNSYIEDESLIPRELCEPSMSLIKEAIKTGELSIPDGMEETVVFGIRLKREPKVVDHGR